MESVQQRIRKLPSLQRFQLLDLWKANFGRKAPEGIRRELMIQVLAYRIQERAHGGLSRESIAELQVSDRDRRKTLGRSALTSAIKSGTRMVREWRGETHEVTVVEDGFQYRGTTYKTLSEIARLITGTRWSGPLFFGLRKREGRERNL